MPRCSAAKTIDLNEFADAREPLMDWLRRKDNPYFAKAFVNRVWANYFNVGIVEPPDDLSLANPPSNKPLLDYLAKGFIEHEFDMKWLHTEIAQQPHLPIELASRTRPTPRTNAISAAPCRAACRPKSPTMPLGWRPLPTRKPPTGCYDLNGRGDCHRWRRRTLQRRRSGGNDAASP